jgi:hypothetical protein
VCFSSTKGVKSCHGVQDVFHLGYKATSKTCKRPWMPNQTSRAKVTARWAFWTMHLDNWQHHYCLKDYCQDAVHAAYSNDQWDKNKNNLLHARIGHWTAIRAECKPHEANKLLIESMVFTIDGTLTWLDKEFKYLGRIMKRNNNTWPTTRLARLAISQDWYS